MSEFPEAKKLNYFLHLQQKERDCSSRRERSIQVEVSWAQRRKFRNLITSTEPGPNRIWSKGSRPSSISPFTNRPQSGSCRQVRKLDRSRERRRKIATAKTSRSTTPRAYRHWPIWRCRRPGPTNTTTPFLQMNQMLLKWFPWKVIEDQIGSSGTLTLKHPWVLSLGWIIIVFFLSKVTNFLF